MRCPKCNHEMKDGAKFCMECGAKLMPEASSEAGKETVFSLQSWKDRKNREKDEAIKRAREEEKERLKQIEQRMYATQDQFEPLSTRKGGKKKEVNDDKA